MKKKILGVFTSVVVLCAVAVVPAHAHIIVSPDQVGIAKTQDFTVSVPNEKDMPIVSVRLVLPNGLATVVPNIAPGWMITTKSNGNSDTTTITEIEWADGSIPVGQRAEFVFQAQVPAKPVTLSWKAYQTYSDGTVVSWDVDPAKMRNLSDAQQDEMADKQNKGVYSTTTVNNDLTASPATSPTNRQTISNTELARRMQWIALIAVISLAFSIIALRMQMVRKKT